MTSFVTTCKLVSSQTPVLYVDGGESVVWGPQGVLKGSSLGPQQNDPITSPLIPPVSHMTTKCITVLVNAGVNDPQLNPDVCPFWL